MEAYTPGEQPDDPNLIKLNTNENPYEPAPRVLKAVREAVGERLRLYPHPTADPLRRKLAALHGCSLDQIIVGNGMDELLALATRAFVEPEIHSTTRRSGRQIIQYFTPSYSLYPVLAAIHGARVNEVPLNTDFSIPRQALIKTAGWKSEVALTYITTPNAPGGQIYRNEDLRRLCKNTKGVIILDEAYADFAPWNTMPLVKEFHHVIVARTFSKAYSLCCQRIGYFVGPEPLITALHKICDSYNVNGLGQVAAAATLDELPYYRENIQRIIQERDRLTACLRQYKFNVLPSATNFILAAPPVGSGITESWFEHLHERGILVRWFPHSAIRRFLRITIGRPKQNRILGTTVGELLKSGPLP
ncbi:MAG: Histidinol-phosphate aminotransferase [Verrucomicrobia subdivision 3 bacterium]|nr:Histidinol-phosphate aminotransferase [Limisphaerales bacterium]MCS1413568.1 Histidinol-phosphate aminotransferase [Limisphaerales bacterium]